MADKGFDITYDVLLRGANLTIPPLPATFKKNVTLTCQTAFHSMPTGSPQMS